MPATSSAYARLRSDPDVQERVARRTYRAYVQNRDHARARVGNNVLTITRIEIQQHVVTDRWCLLLGLEGRPVPLRVSLDDEEMVTLVIGRSVLTRGCLRWLHS